MSDEANVETGVVRTAKPKRKRAKVVPAADFIRAIQTSETAAEAAKKLGMNVNSLHTRASQYRTEHGINLKHFPRGGGSALDVAALNAMISSMETEKADAAEAESAEVAQG